MNLGKMFLLFRAKEDFAVYPFSFAVVFIKDIIISNIKIIVIYIVHVKINGNARVTTNSLSHIASSSAPNSL